MITSTNNFESMFTECTNFELQRSFNKAASDNIETIRKYGLDRIGATAINISRYTENNFLITKLSGVIQYVGFSSVGAITGTLPDNALISIGATFYLFNESEDPATNIVTVNLGSHEILTDDSITELVLDHNDYILILTYIAENTFLAYKMMTGV